MLPIGQLDGGHVVFGLFSTKVSRRVNEVVFTIFLFYAGLGWVSPNQLLDLSMGSSFSYLLMILVYLYLLYLATTSMIPRRMDRLMYGAILFSIQFIVNYFTGWQGYGGWLLFSLIIGRFLGVYHPPVADNRPLTPFQQVMGWIAVLVFILCFSPRPIILE